MISLKMHYFPMSTELGPISLIELELATMVRSNPCRDQSDGICNTKINKAIAFEETKAKIKPAYLSGKP